MSDLSDYGPEMHEMDLTGAQIEALLSGAATGADAGVGDLADVLAQIRTLYGAEDVPAVGAALSEFVALDLIADKGDLLVTAASNASGPAVQVAELPKWRDTFTNRRQRMISSISTFVGTLTGKIVLGATVAAAATGGVGAAGVIDIPIVPDLTDQPTVVQIDEPDTGELDLNFDDLDVDEVDDSDVDEGDTPGTDDIEDVDADEGDVCSAQADAIEDAAEGQGEEAEEAEEAAEQAADDFEEACEIDDDSDDDDSDDDDSDDDDSDDDDSDDDDSDDDDSDDYDSDDYDDDSDDDDDDSDDDDTDE